MKKKKIVTIASFILLLFLAFRLINPSITKNISSLDCKSEYKQSFFESAYEGYNYHNSKIDIAKCLCEKYKSSNNKQYETELRNILNEFEAYEAFRDQPVADICKNKDSIFSYWHYE